MKTYSFNQTRKHARCEKRRQKNREKLRLKDLGPEYCHHCGGTMVWCEGCVMFSATCCEEYGTCMCS